MIFSQDSVDFVPGEGEAPEPPEPSPDYHPAIRAEYLPNDPPTNGDDWTRPDGDNEEDYQVLAWNIGMRWFWRVTYWTEGMASRQLIAESKKSEMSLMNVAKSADFAIAKHRRGIK